VVKWITNFWNRLFLKKIPIKKCWLCEKPSLELNECCNHLYCNSCFSEHNTQFHNPLRPEPENIVPREKKTNTYDDYTVSDPTNSGVMRYSHKKPLSREEKLQKDLEDGYRW
jgi:hypothetical protein